MLIERPLTAGEWSVLALLCEESAHGWALASLLAPDAEIGRIWTLRKSLVYRALELLHERELVEVAGSAASPKGPSRTVYRATEEGRSRLARWLAEPVEHIRDLRPDLLLKLAFAERAAVDTSALLDAQRLLLAEIVAGLERRLEGASGAEAILLRYQVETAGAATRFVGLTLTAS
jgi:DNA-binding PadR family transcriptional regulator